MPDQIVLHFDGTPQPQPRPRAVRGHITSAGALSKAGKAWRAQVEAVCAAARDGLDLDGEHAWFRGALCVDLLFWFATDKAERHDGPHTAKPDKDNLEKMVLDCADRVKLLPKGDQRVSGGFTHKLWAPRPGALMRLRPWSPPPIPGDDDDMGADPDGPAW